MKFLIFLIVFSSSITFAKTNYSIELKKFEKHQEVHFSGEIKTPFENKTAIKKVLKNLERNKNILVYIDKSWGGVVASFKKIIKGIKNKCNGDSCVITTYIEKHCGSACIDLLMAGDNRLMAHNAKLGFHRTWVIHPTIPISSARIMANQYKKMGANPDWIDANMHIFDVSEVTMMGVSAQWIFWSEAKAGNFITEWSPTDFLEYYRSQN